MRPSSFCVFSSYFVVLCVCGFFVFVFFLVCVFIFRFWFCFIFSLVVDVGFFFCLPATLQPSECEL